MASQEIQSLALDDYNLIFYKLGTLPTSLETTSDMVHHLGVNTLKDWLLSKGPLLGSGPYLSPRYYEEGGLTQVPFHKEVCNEQVYHWSQFHKKNQEVGDDNIIVRGLQHLEGKWVVYYSMADAPDRLYLILHEVFTQRVGIYSSQSLKESGAELFVGGDRMLEKVGMGLNDEERI